MKIILPDAFWRFLGNLMQNEKLCLEGKILRWTLSLTLAASSVIAVVGFSIFVWRYAFGG